MGYRRSNYGYGGGYVGGRWRSEAWHMDGGANDEGWHYRFVTTAARKLSTVASRPVLTASNATTEW